MTYTIEELRSLWFDGDPNQPLPYNKPANKRTINTPQQELGYYLWEYENFESAINDLMNEIKEADKLREVLNNLALYAKM